MSRLTEVLSESFYIGLAFAALAGIITVFSPCALSNASLIITFVAGLNADRKKAFLYSIMVCIGQMAIFVALGVIAALAGKLFSGNHIMDMVWHILLGLLMLFMALELTGVTGVLSRFQGGSLILKVRKKGALGAFLLGLMGGFCCIPCTLPILAATLAYVATVSAGALKSALILIAYSLGHSVPLIIAGTSLGAVNQLTNSEKFRKINGVIKFIFGMIIFVMGAFLIIHAIME
ncbi:MAG: cytochrome c biogenesis CcdA family protein [Christensenellales bacterium]